MIKNKVKLTISVTPEVLEQLNNLSEMKGVNRSAMVSVLVSQAYRAEMERPNVDKLFSQMRDILVTSGEITDRITGGDD